MDKLTFKNYPPTILAILLCVIVALNFGFKVLWGTIWEHKTFGLWDEILCIFFSYSTVLAVFTYINKNCMWKWVLKLLGVCDIRGKYVGKVISSYHIEDDLSKPHIELFCKMQIIQNINAIKIEGNFYTDKECTNRSSHFASFWEEIKKKENGDFDIRYFFSSKGSQLHPDNAKHGLTNHDGVCVLTFNPKSHTLKGYYFNHERFSNGEIYLELQ